MSAMSSLRPKISWKRRTPGAGEDVAGFTRRARMLPWRSGICAVSSIADIPVTEGIVMWLRLAVPDQVGDSLRGRGFVGKAPTRSGHGAEERCGGL